MECVHCGARTLGRIKSKTAAVCLRCAAAHRPPTVARPCGCAYDEACPRCYAAKEAIWLASQRRTA